MKTNLTLFVFLVSLLAATAEASNLTDKALGYIPEGKVVQEKAKEVKIQTPQGTIVEVEFMEDGTFEEASGDIAERDIFIPGQGLITLQKAHDAMKKTGKTITGDWSLEKSFLKGWYYEFEGFENGRSMDYSIDAKTGKLLEAQVDD